MVVSIFVLNVDIRMVVTDGSVETVVCAAVVEQSVRVVVSRDSEVLTLLITVVLVVFVE